MVKLSLSMVAAVSVMVAASGSSAAHTLRGDLRGEVRARVSLTPGQREHHKGFKSVQAVVSVTITPEKGNVVLREMIFTNTKITMWLPAGRYSVSAEIGPPTVNPRPRECGKEQVVVGKKEQASFMLECPLR